MNSTTVQKPHEYFAGVKEFALVAGFGAGCRLSLQCFLLQLVGAAALPVSGAIGAAVGHCAHKFIFVVTEEFVQRLLLVQVIYSKQGGKSCLLPF